MSVDDVDGNEGVSKRRFASFEFCALCRARLRSGRTSGSSKASSVRARHAPVKIGTGRDVVDTADDAIQGVRQLDGGFRRYAWATCLGTAILAATNCVNPSASNANYLRVPGAGLALRRPAMAPALSPSSMTETVWLDG